VSDATVVAPATEEEVAAAVLCGAVSLRLFARQGFLDVLGLVRTLPGVRTAVPTGGRT
jgi:hypothetical protein